MKTILCNKYEVLKPIAEGGMGTVYLVKDLHLNRLAAVKVSKNPEMGGRRENAHKEMKVLKQLSHPALPQINDFFEENGNIYLVMEYVDGITLEQYLRKFTKVETEKAVRWAVELTEVLSYLHSKNPPIIYRDLKPANIIIQPDGRLKLIDFGAAFVTDFGRNREQFVTGTPGYSAPEQWESGGARKETDIYGLGAVLHEMLTGIHPGQQGQERRPVREYDKSISPQMDKIISQCTKIRPGDRYRDMEQLRKALLNYDREDRVGKFLFNMKKLIGILCWLAVAIKTFYPLLKGVEIDRFPFPYLEQPLLLTGIAAIYQTLFLARKDRRILRKQEKSIFLTEKKFSGIYVAVVLLSFFLGTMAEYSFSGTGVAAGEKETLWVEMRDAEGRKLLVKEGTYYQPGERTRLEIPMNRIPEEQVALQLVAEGKEGTIYTSRVFLLEQKNAD